MTADTIREEIETELSKFMEQYAIAPNRIFLTPDAYNDVIQHISYLNQHIYTLIYNDKGEPVKYGGIKIQLHENSSVCLKRVIVCLIAE